MRGLGLTPAPILYSLELGLARDDFDFAVLGGLAAG
jgi:hypothetical protein